MSVLVLSREGVQIAFQDLKYHVHGLMESGSQVMLLRTLDRLSRIENKLLDIVQSGLCRCENRHHIVFYHGWQDCPLCAQLHEKGAEL